jgi:Undecaprenyl-phosphate glucose phosphotransferase
MRFPHDIELHNGESVTQNAVNVSGPADFRLLEGSANPSVGDGLERTRGSQNPTQLFLNDPRVCAIFVLLDAIVLFLGSLAGWFIYHQLASGILSQWWLYVVTSLTFSAIFIIIALTGNCYSFLWGGDRSVCVVGTFKTYMYSFMLFVCMLFFGHFTDAYSRFTLIAQFMICGTMLMALRSVELNFIQKSVRNQQILTNRIVLVGAQVELDRLMNNWNQNRQGIEIVASYTIPERKNGKASLHNSYDGLVAEVVSKAREQRPDRVVILLPLKSHDVIDFLVKRLAVLPVGIFVSPGESLPWGGKASVLKFGGVQMLRIVRRPLFVTERLLKRSFDVSVSAGLLVALAPLFVLVGLAIRLESPGPVFFRQKRKGFNQRPFNLFKFRSMNVDAESSGFVQATRLDSRVTRAGRILRRFNIDELPQLFNVLTGEMSLVGPRPHAVEHDDQFSREIAEYARRHNVKPGITGWAQVNGFRGETDTLEKMEDRVHHDILYIDNWSFIFDLKILLMTVFSPSAYRNAY